MSFVRTRAHLSLTIALSAGVLAPSSSLAQSTQTAEAPGASGQSDASVTPPPAEGAQGPTVTAQADPNRQGSVTGPNPITTGGLTPPGSFAAPGQEGAAIAPSPEDIRAAEQAEVPPPDETPPDPTTTPATAFDLQTVTDDLSGLRTDVENFKFQWQRERDIHTAITTRFLQLGGNIQARFWWIDDATNQAGTVYKRKSAFDVPTAQINMTGSLYRDYEEGRNLTYAVSFGISQQQNSNNSWLNLQNANVAYSFLPTANGPEAPQLTLTVGQQLLPFGLEAQASEELRPVIRNALFTQNATNGGGGLGLTRREVGAIVRGDLFPLVDFGYNFRVPVLAYALGVVNGTGANNPDDNNKKDLIARLAFTVPTEFNSWLRQFTVGGTVYYGKQNLTIKDPGDATSARNLVIGTGKRERYGLDVYYNHWPFGVTYEFIVGKDETASGKTKESAVRYVRESIGHTATFFLSFGEQFVASFRQQGRFDDWWPKTYQPFVRVDTFNYDKNKPHDVVTTYTGGFNLFFAETTKFQLNYNLRWDSSTADFQKDKTVSKTGWTHEALAQIQFGF